MQMKGFDYMLTLYALPTCNHYRYEPSMYVHIGICRLLNLYLTRDLWKFKMMGKQMIGWKLQQFQSANTRQLQINPVEH